MWPRGLTLVWLGHLLLLATTGPASAEQPVAAERLTSELHSIVERMQSEDCRIRQRAFRDFFRSVDREQLTRTEHLLERDYPSAAALREGVTFLAALSSAEARAAEIYRVADEAAEQEDGAVERRAGQLAMRAAEAALETLPSQPPVHQFVLVLFLFNQARGADEGVAQFVAERLGALLRDRNSSLRIVTAIALLDDVEAGRLIPFEERMQLLLEGLESPDPSIRLVSSLRAGRHVHPDLCYNPLDPPAVREGVVQTLRARWRQVFALLGGPREARP